MVNPYLKKYFDELMYLVLGVCLLYILGFFPNNLYGIKTEYVIIIIIAFGAFLIYQRKLIEDEKIIDTRAKTLKLLKEKKKQTEEKTTGVEETTDKLGDFLSTRRIK